MFDYQISRDLINKSLEPLEILLVVPCFQLGSLTRSSATNKSFGKRSLRVISLSLFKKSKHLSNDSTRIVSLKTLNSPEDSSVKSFASKTFNLYLQPKAYAKFKLALPSANSRGSFN